MRDLMRRYIDQRIQTYENVSNEPETLAHNRQAIDLQSEIWNRARQSCQASGSQSATMLLIPALNDMIDITSSRAAAARTHAPLLILFLPFAVALFSALVAGYAMAESDHLKTLHALIFAAVVSITVYVILDLEYPRTGLIRIIMRIGHVRSAGCIADMSVLERCDEVSPDTQFSVRWGRESERIIF